jgi:hypothetical protein
VAPRVSLFHGRAGAAAGSRSPAFAGLTDTLFERLHEVDHRREGRAGLGNLERAAGRLLIDALVVNVVVLGGVSPTTRSSLSHVSPQAQLEEHRVSTLGPFLGVRAGTMTVAPAPPARGLSQDQSRE